MPFKLKTRRQAELADKLQDLARAFSPFVVKLEGFGAFPPRVIYIDVVESPELKNLQQAINRQMKVKFQVFNANYRDRPFRPHLTLAFRDLKKAQFREAWTEFQHTDVQYSWKASQFSLLKHDGHRWQTWRDFYLGE